MAATYGILPTFDHTIQVWKTFKDRISQWFIANELSDTKDPTKSRRRAILLSTLNDGTYTLASDLSLPKELASLQYDDIIRLFDNHFTLKVCGFGERCKFYEAVQQPGETHSQWAARLRGLSEQCEFNDVNEALRDRFVMGMRPGPERVKLFSQDPLELTLAKAVDVAGSVRSTFMESTSTNDLSEGYTGQANQVVELNVKGGALELNKMSEREEAPYAPEDTVVGLNFHKSKEVLIVDRNGASAPTNGDVRLTFLGKIKALLQKNLLRMRSNIGVMLLIFVLPVMQVILFCLAIGRDPSGLKLAIVNADVNVINGYCPYDHDCSMTNLSCRYLDHLKEQSIIKEYYADLTSALNAVKDGDAWGAIYFNENYTDALVARFALANEADDETIESSEIQVWLDMSNQQIGLMLNRDIQFSYQDFSKDLLLTCEQNPKKGNLPIHFREPIYGDTNPSFTDFVAPGVILTIVFFLNVALTSSGLIVERTEGLLGLSWAAGDSPREVLFSHVVTQLVVMCGQTALVLGFMIIVFEVKCNGNVAFVIMLTLMQGVCGMCFGFFISAACKLERNAIQLAHGSFYATLLLSGVIWPIEGMYWILRYVSLCLPLTLATSSLRSILIRGWPITDPEVYMGFVSTFIWIALSLVLTITILKFKRIGKLKL